MYALQIETKHQRFTRVFRLPACVNSITTLHWELVNPGGGCPVYMSMYTCYEDCIGYKQNNRF